MRQYKSFVLVVQVMLAVQTMVAGFERTTQPAFVTGKGMAGTADARFELLFINPAAVTAVTSFRSSLFYAPSPFQLPALAGGGLITGFPLGGLHFAAGFTSFGFSLYRETDGIVSLGAELHEGFTAGVNLHLAHLSLERYGSAAAGVIDLGVIYSLSPSLNAGVALQNVAGADLGREDDIPRTLVTGLSFTLEELAVVNADLIKDVRYPAMVRVGADLLLHQNLSVRAGIQTDPSRMFWGFSLIVATFRIDYAMASHGELGPSHSIGISVE